MYRTLDSLTAIVAGSLALTTPAHAQHFAKPAPVDTSTVEQIATPTFTIPRPSTSFGSVVDDGWLYVMGGYTGRPHDYYSEAQSRDFYRVNLLDPTHIVSLPDTEGMQACPLEAWNGYIIRTGGLQALNKRGEEQTLRSLDTARWFDPAANSWNDLPSLPVARSSHDSAVVGSKLYVIGGWTLDDTTGERSWIDQVHVLDLKDPDSGWDAVDAPFQRRALASVAVGEDIVVIGGMTSQGGTSSDVNVFNTATGSWSTAPSFPGNPFGVAADAHNGVITAAGTDGVVYTLQVGSEQGWQAKAALTFPRFFHQIATDDMGNSLVFGGISRGVRPVHVERIDARPEVIETARVAAHWTVPSPSTAKNRQGMTLRDGWLWAFGGNNSTGQHDFQQDNFLSEGFRLSLAGLSWRQIDDLPAARQTIQTSMTTDERTTYAIGGFGHDGDVARTFDHGFSYNHETREWNELGVVLPEPRSQYGLVEHRGTLWAFGGLDYDSRREQGDQFRHLTNVVAAPLGSAELRFDDTDIELTEPRRAFGGAKLGDAYYLVSGMRENFTIVESAEKFDFNTQRFTPIAQPSRPRLSPSMVALSGKLFMAGGSSPKADGSGLEANTSIEMYDPDTDTWPTVMDEIPITPRHMRMATHRGRLVLISSHTDESNRTEIVLVDVPGSGA